MLAHTRKIVMSRFDGSTGAPGRAHRRCTLVFIAGLVAPMAHAQPSAPKAASFDPVVVTAARGPQSIEDLLADLTVIDRDEIARSGADGLAKLLSRHHGIEIVQNGGPASTSGVFIRGANRGQTVVLLDGIRLESSTAGAASLEAIPLDQIERIEILRGPASALYGADAIGGVIQVFTRRAGDTLAANASAGVGTHATAKGSAGVSGSAGPLRYSVQAGAQRSDGFNAIVDTANWSYDPDRDGYRAENVSASIGLDWAKEQSLGARYFRNRLNAQFDAGDAFDDRTVTVVEAWQVDSRNRLAANWRSSLVVGRSTDDSTTTTAFGSSPFRTENTQLTWQNDLSLPAGDLSLGYERREERVDEDVGFPVTARDTDSAFGVYRLVSGPWALQGNLRYDHSTQFGSHTTGTLAIGWRFAPGWRLSASGGTAFKVPTFNDLYFPGYSNPDLEPETARNFEGSLAWNGSIGDARVGASATGWHNRVSDLIVFVCDANYACAPQNVSRATLEGVTLAGDLAWRDTTVRGSINLQNPTDDATGNLLPRRARTYGALSVLQRAGPTTLGVELVAASKRYDDAANTREMAGYAVVNLVAEWTPGHGVTLFVRADNVFDRDYEVAAGYATGGAQVFGGVRWAM